MYKQHVYTDEDVRYIKENYGKLPTKKIADHVGIKKEALISWCNRRGMKNGRFFTEQEKRYIERNAGKVCRELMAKKLGCTYDKINSHMYKNGITVNGNLENRITLAELSKLVNRDKETIKETWVKYGLIIKKLGRYSVIDIDDLFDFMKNNPERWDATECEKWFFEMHGCEWFEIKRKVDFNNKVEKRWGNYHRQISHDIETNM